MASIGVFNGNWRGADMREYVNSIRDELTPKTLHELGSCGHELKSRPLWMVGKSTLCFSCWEADAAEQKRLMETMSAEYRAAYDEELADTETQVTIAQLTREVYGEAPDTQADTSQSFDDYFKNTYPQETEQRAKGWREWKKAHPDSSPYHF